MERVRDPPREKHSAKDNPLQSKGTTTEKA